MGSTDEHYGYEQTIVPSISSSECRVFIKLKTQNLEGLTIKDHEKKERKTQ